MAVGFRTCDQFVRDVGAAARAVLDQDLLAPAFRKPFADDPGDHVSRPSGCERHDDTDGTGRPSLGACPLGSGGRHERRCGSERIEATAGDHHDTPPAALAGWTAYPDRTTLYSL